MGSCIVTCLTYVKPVCFGTLAAVASHCHASLRRIDGAAGNEYPEDRSALISTYSHSPYNK